MNPTPAPFRSTIVAELAGNGYITQELEAVVEALPASARPTFDVPKLTEVIAIGSVAEMGMFLSTAVEHGPVKLDVILTRFGNACQEAGHHTDTSVQRQAIENLVTYSARAKSWPVPSNDDDFPNALASFPGVKNAFSLKRSERIDANVTAEVSSLSSNLVHFTSAVAIADGFLARMHTDIDPVLTKKTLLDAVAYYRLGRKVSAHVGDVLSQRSRPPGWDERVDGGHAFGDHSAMYRATLAREGQSAKSLSDAAVSLLCTATPASFVALFSSHLSSTDADVYHRNEMKDRLAYVRAHPPGAHQLEPWVRGAGYKTTEKGRNLNLDFVWLDHSTRQLIADAGEVTSAELFGSVPPALVTAVALWSVRNPQPWERVADPLPLVPIL